MQLEIDRLRRRLRYEQQRRTSSDSGPFSNDDGDSSYRPRSRTPPSESFLYDEDRHYKQRSKSHLSKVQAMMLWVGLLDKSLNHRFLVKLKGESFLGNLLNQNSPCIMAEWTLWSTSATSTREWPFIPGTKPWCAKCSHLVWGPWRWDGSMVWKKVLLAPLRSLLGPLGLDLWLAVGFLSL